MTLTTLERKTATASPRTPASPSMGLKPTYPTDFGSGSRMPKSTNAPQAEPFSLVMAGLCTLVLLLTGYFLVDWPRDFSVCEGQPVGVTQTNLRQMANDSFPDAEYQVDARRGYNGDWHDDLVGRTASETSPGC